MRTNYIVPVVCIIIMLIIALTSCDKEEFNTEETLTITNHTETDTIIAAPAPDTTINRVGCYYPIYP